MNYDIKIQYYKNKGHIIRGIRTVILIFII